MNKHLICLIGALLTSSLLHAAHRPNVVLIVCDDLNDYMNGIPGESGHPQAIIPNVEKLAQSGVAFRRAYSNTPVCAPSRASFLTGIYPHTSGNFFWDKWWTNSTLNNSRTMMEHFRANGYHVAGTGKMMHHFKREVWSEFAHEADYGPFAHNGEKKVAHPSVPLPFGSIGAVDGSYGPLEDIPFFGDDDPMSGWVLNAPNWESRPMHYVSDSDRDPTPDERNASWAANRIQTFANEGTDQPFFLGIGFIRPHTPLHVPKKYFDLYPLESLELPIINKGDADDTHFKNVYPANVKGLRYFQLLKQSYPDIDAGLRAFTQAYLASVTAVDECIGQVVDAIDKSPFRDNTIIILTSDHGWAMGQKDYLFKNSPWEESGRVPFIVRAPNIAQAGGVAEHPISLIDLYPTLVDLCNLDRETRKNEKGASLDGFSVRPFLENPSSEVWDGPDGALTMIYAGQQSDEDKVNPAKQNWSYRTKDWRYIRYRDGIEELYDHQQDPYEWNNRANDPELAPIKAKLSKAMSQQIVAEEIAAR